MALRISTGFLIFGVGAIISCTTVEVDDDLVPHLLIGSPDGDFHLVRSATYSEVPLRADVTDERAVSPTSTEALQRVNSILDNIEAQASGPGKIKRVVLFVHGGLNTHEAGLSRAATLYRAALDAGAYPVFVNWKSGGFSAYGGHLFQVRDGHRAGTSAKLTWPVYLAADALGAIGVAPKAWWQQGTESLAFSLSDSADIREPIDPGSSVEIDYVEPTPTSQLSYLKNFAIWLATSPTKLVSTPISYAFGKPSWDVMNRRAHEMVFRSCEFERDERRCELTAMTSPKLYGAKNIANLSTQDNTDSVCKTPSELAICSGVLAVFLKELYERKRHCNATAHGLCNAEIAIVGHSMGAIVVADTLRYFRHLRFDNIVFMGAAVSSRDALNALVPYMQDRRNHASQFYNLSLNVTLESRERNWFGLIPDGTLLTWIDSMYGMPPNEIDRTFGRWENARTAMRLVPPELAPRMHFRIFGNGDTDPVDHASFSLLPFWEPAFWWPENRSKVVAKKKSPLPDSVTGEPPMTVVETR